MNSNRELELEELRLRLEEIRDELEDIASNEQFSLEYDELIGTESEGQAELTVASVTDAASRVDEAIEFIEEALT